ncbi:MAG: HtaA domain-containing protein [Solirubrobacterales bacterium]
MSAAIAIRRAMAVGAAFAALAAAPAAAAAASGKTTLRLNGPAAQLLRAQGIAIAPAGAARGGERRLVLPTGAGLAGETTTLLRQRGAIVFRSGPRRARLTGLSLVLGKRGRVEARLAGESLNLFTLDKGGRRQVDPVGGSASLAGLKLTLTATAARALAAKLGLRHVARGRFGVLAARARGLTTSGTSPGSRGGGSAGSGTPAGSPGSKGASPAPSAACPLPGSAGPAPESPLPVLARPPAAVDVTAATLDWQVRESFVRYIASGEGASVSGGAVADPPVLMPGASAALSYGFQFPFASGWLDPGADPASTADDTALVRFGGAVQFRYSAHGIDLSTAEPELELRGPASRAIFAIAEDGGAATRQVLVNLDLGAAAAIRAEGGSFTYERVPGAIPAGTASSTFAGFYAPGTDFGCFTVSFQTGG